MKVGILVFTGLAGGFSIICGINVLLIIADNNLATEKHIYQFGIKTK
ncbi:MAG: hypothetical protein ACJAWT_000751 [Glaciecola sp.]|jgi:hypothetical protein